METHMGIEKIQYWFYRKKINTISLGINFKPLKSSDLSIFDDKEIKTLFGCKKLVKPNVFECYNNVFNFSLELHILGSNNYIGEIQTQLSSIKKTSECSDKKVNFKWVEGVANSRVSDFFEKWSTFFQFGKHAYEIHLRGYKKLVTKHDWQDHYKDLLDFFERLQKTRRGINFFYYQSWCDRYYIDNSDTSRRSAACSYFAKKGDAYFDKLVYFSVKEETIDWAAIENIENIADSYVIYANPSFHKRLETLIIESGIPIGICSTLTNRINYHDKSVILYLLLQEDFINKSINDSEICKAYIYQRNLIKPKFDDLKRKGKSNSLTNYIKFITDVWRSNSTYIK